MYVTECNLHFLPSTPLVSQKARQGGRRALIHICPSSLQPQPPLALVSSEIHTFQAPRSELDDTEETPSHLNRRHRNPPARIEAAMNNPLNVSGWPRKPNQFTLQVLVDLDIGRS